MEKKIKIKTKDKKVIYGTLSSSQKPSRKLVVFVPGFLGNQNEHIFFNGAKYLMNKGVDAFRFDLYSGEKGGRHFRDTKISIHGKDLNSVINHFKNKYKKIYLVGHSYGGTTLLFTDPSNITAMIFWDAAYVKPRKKEFPYNKKFKSFIVDWGYEAIVGQGYVDELKNFPDCGELIKKINVPVKFITAGVLGNEKAGKEFFAKANNPKKLVNIKTADHNFNGFKEEERLLEETYAYIKYF